MNRSVLGSTSTLPTRRPAFCTLYGVLHSNWTEKPLAFRHDSLLGAPMRTFSVMLGCEPRGTTKRRRRRLGWPVHGPGPFELNRCSTHVKSFFRTNGCRAPQAGLTSNSGSPMTPGAAGVPDLCRSGSDTTSAGASRLIKLSPQRNSELDGSFSASVPWQRSRFHCSDTRGWLPIHRIASCAGVFAGLPGATHRFMGVSCFHVARTSRARSG